MFHLKIHQNNIFFIFLKLFLLSTHQNNLKTKKYLILNKKLKNKIIKKLDSTVKIIKINFRHDVSFKKLILNKILVLPLEGNLPDPKT
jgi:hypothetical protein